MTNQPVAVALTVADWWFVLGALYALHADDFVTPQRLIERIYEALDA